MSQTKVTDAMRDTTSLDVSDLSGAVPVAKGGTGATTHTANNVLVGNGTSAIASVAPSTSGNVLTSNGSVWASSAPAAGGVWSLAGSATASSSSSITVTGLSGAPFMIMGKDLHPDTDNVFGYIQLGDSSGVDTGSTDYAWYNFGRGVNGTEAANPSGYQAYQSAHIAVSTYDNSGDIGNQADSGVSFQGMCENPRGAEQVAAIHGNAGIYHGGDNMYIHIEWGGVRQAKITTDRILFAFNSGNIVSGSIYIYELATS